jgi:predicted phosphate transport protein (TIGR00153 family)
MAVFMQDAAKALNEMMADQSGEYDHHVKRIKTIEHQADELTHTITNKLNKSFITPFDREDIYALASRLDDIIDGIDDAARTMLMYDVHASTNHSRHFAQIIQSLATEMKECIAGLGKPHGISPRLIEIRRLENEGDELFHTAIGELFHSSNDPLTIIKWKNIYEKLEATIDSYQDAGSVIESVILKHS